MKKVILILIGIGVSALVIIINWLYAKAKLVNADTVAFGNPLATMAIRNDVQGKGSFWQSRVGGKYHEGIDLLCKKGQAVYAPIDGVIARKAYPYANDSKYEGCVIYNSDTKTEVKFFYMICNRVGDTVKKGDAIGYCQAINEKYGSTMKNHLHIEIRVDGKLVNPESIFKNSLS